MQRLPLILLFACSSSSSEPPPAPAQRGHQGVDALERSLDGLAEEIVQKLGENKKSKLGVNEFLTLKGDNTELGKFVAEELTTRLIKSGKAQVVERRLLQKVLSEQEMGASNLVDDETA